MRRLLLVLAIVAAACGKNNDPPPPSSGSPNAQPESGPSHARGHATKDPVAQAQDMFGNVCAMCHGVSGAGDGPAAVNLTPKPRNYTDPAWQASVTDDQIRKTILEGGQAVGKSPMMPGQPQLKDQPEVLDNLVKIIRGFGKK
ncbi:MAG TPA: cytochrome c [Kofleriaceae bacterium]|jgi:cytochrome c553|nr:cytochrome c [Kofleriaceae bacterium]